MKDGRDDVRLVQVQLSGQKTIRLGIHRLIKNDAVVI